MSLFERIYGTMALTGDKLQIALEMRNWNQQCMNVWHYEVTGALTDVPAASIAEAWWNHVKTAYRAIATAGIPEQRFLMVHVRDADNPVGEAVSWNIPIGEQSGTRTAPGTGGDALPPYVAVTGRLGVGTRATRSGSKRFPFALEADQVNGVVAAGYVASIQACLSACTEAVILGVPALAVELVPMVRGVGASNPPVVTYQRVISTQVNTYISTQNSRKFGRGA